MKRNFARDPEKAFVASQSSLGTLLSCEEKFVHRYYKATPRDENWIEPTYFSFGSAFHEILDLCAYNKSKLTEDLIRSQVEIRNLEWLSDGAKIKACLETYFQGNEKEEQLIASEVEIFTEDFVMYADAIMQDKEGWYIVDMKTVGRTLDDMIQVKLRRDPQMCLYASHAAHFAEKLGLEKQKFLGMSYREVEKPRQRTKKNETHEEFFARCTPTVYRETFLPRQTLHIDETMFALNMQLQRARVLKSETPVKNVHNCKKNGLVCEFWSQCYGEPYKYEP